MYTRTFKTILSDVQAAVNSNFSDSEKFEKECIEAATKIYIAELQEANKRK